MTPGATRIRSAGEGPLDAREVALPDNLRPGTNQMVVGVYEPADMTRWSIVAADTDRVSDDRLTLGSVEIH